MTEVKKALFCTISLLAESPFLVKKVDNARIRVKSTRFPPIISPRAISGNFLKTALKSTKKLGNEVANAIIKKVITNSRHLKYFATLIKELIKRELNQERKMLEIRNIDATKYQVTVSL